MSVSSPRPTGSFTLPVGSLRIGLVIWLYAINIVAYADRQVIALLKPELARIFHWADKDYALIITGFQISVAVCLLGAGWFIDKVGLRRGMALSVGGWSIAATLHAFARTLPQFLAARIALGALEATATPGGVKIVATGFAPKDRGMVIGIINTAPNVSAFATPLIVGALFALTGWQWTIGLVGASGLVCVVFWWLLPIEKLAAVTPQPLETPVRGKEPSIFRDRHTWALAIGKVMSDQVWWFMLFWLPDFLHRQYQVDLAHLGLPVASVYAMAAAGSFLGGWIPGRLRRLGVSAGTARRIALGLFALLPIPLVATPWLHGLWPTVLVAGLALAGHQGFATNLFSLAVTAFPAHRVGSVVGFAAFCGNVSGALVLQVAGWLLSTRGSLDLMFIECGLAYAAGWLVLKVLVPTLRSDEAAPSLSPDISH